MTAKRNYSGRAVRNDSAPTEQPVRAEIRSGTRASSSSFVSVACKVPNGIELQNYKMVDSAEPLTGGGQRMVKVAHKDGPPIRINGPSRYHGAAPTCQIVMGFAITPRVPADHWERWLAANKDSAIVKNGLIFANPDRDSLRDEAEDHRKQFSGLEPLARRGDPRAEALARRKNKLKIEEAAESSKPFEDDHDPENIEPDEG